MSSPDRNLLSSCSRSCYSSTFISIIAYSRVRHISSVYIHHTTSGVITPLRNVSPHRSRPACAFSPRSVGMPRPRHWQHPYISSSYFRDPRHPTLSTSFPTAGLLTPFLPLFLLEIRSSAVIVSPVPLNLPYFNPPMCTQKPFLQHAIVSRRIRRLRRGRGSGAWSRRMQYEGMILYKLGDRCSRSVNHLGEGKEKEERESDLIIVTYCWYSIKMQHRVSMHRRTAQLSRRSPQPTFSQRLTARAGWPREVEKVIHESQRAGLGLSDVHRLSHYALIQKMNGR